MEQQSPRGPPDTLLTDASLHVSWWQCWEVARRSDVTPGLGFHGLTGTVLFLAVGGIGGTGQHHPQKSSRVDDAVSWLFQCSGWRTFRIIVTEVYRSLAMPADFLVVLFREGGG